MGNQSYSSSQIISTPSGGGALKGIGETFAADLHTGTGNFTVPISLPPGRKGFQPELNLAYSTGNGNGPFGLGWQLSIPGVRRKTSKGVPRYDDVRDTFILSGAEDLVAVDKSASYTRFRPRTEGLFARIDRHHDATNDFWEVRSKDGLVSRYGTPAAAGNDPAVIADPTDRTKVFSWQLTQTKDPFGNRIEYEYQRDSQEEDPRHWDQLYLKKIHYVDYRKRNDPDKVHFLVSVAFIYEDDLASAATERPDPFSEYRAGFEIRTRRRCKRIEIRMHTDAEVSELVRTYEFIYLDERLPASELPMNRVSLLSRINVTGHNGAATEQLPPLEFAYSRFEPKDARDFYPVEGPLPARSLANPELELADLSGNGLPDILELNGTARYWRNLGHGRFDLPREMRDAPAGLALADADVQLLDADGDARIDLMVTRSGLSGYFPLQPDGEWHRRTFHRYRQAPSVNLEDPEVHLVDLTGDGVTDAVRSGSRLECFFNHPQEGWNETRFLERKDLDAFPNVNFSDPRVKWADMTGDGLQDIVLVHDGNVEYWPNLGRGNWGRRVHMQHSPRLPHGYDPRRILIGDVDGDGAADFVYVDHCKVILWINRSGNSWSDPIAIDGTPPVSNQDSVSLVDLLGTGIRGVLWSSNRNASNRPNLFFLDFTGRVKPYLLNRMTNHLGAQTRVAYEPSIAFYLQDRQQRKPWQATLPFPVQVVSRVEVIDEISGGKLTTEYRYHHGYWDGDEREFRGFGRVEQLDTETFSDYDSPGLHGQDASFNRVEQTHFSPPTLTKTWFHQGPVVQADGDWIEPDWSDEYWTGDPHLLQHPETVNDFLGGLPDRRTRRDALRALRGSILRTELYAHDASAREDRPYTVTEFGYNVREQDLPVDGDTDRRHIFFPHTLAQRTTQWERGDEPMTQFAVTEDFDNYGQPRTQISIAVPRNRDFRVAAATGEPYLATHTVTDYAQKDIEEVFITDRTSRTTTYEILNDGSLPLFDLKQRITDVTAPRRVIGQTLNFYDGSAFTGLPFGEIGEHGVLKRSETLVLTDDVLRNAYPDGDPTLTSSDPPYFAHTGSPSWPDEYPQPFAASYPTDQHADATRPRLKITPLGHGFADAGPDSPYEPGGYFVAAQRLDHDPNGLVIAQRDPLGRDSAERDVKVEYDMFNLLPVKVTDPVGLETKSEYDYRVLQPKQITEPNHNVQAFAFSPLGFPIAIFIRGKDGEGDAAQAGTRFEYNLLAFENSPEDDRQPVWVRTIQREHHDSTGDGDATIETVEYSDGFSRLVQTRTQAEEVIWGENRLFGSGVLPLDQTDIQETNESFRGHRRAEGDPANVRVSGWKTYDNKGRVVEQYEPFFAQGWDYLSREEATALRDGGGPDLFGQKVTQFFDPRGQVVRTVNPNDSEQHVIYGVPGSIAQPDVTRRDRNCEVIFEPTPWEVYTYDANDNAGCTHRGASGSYAHHWDTPSSIEIDALGRTVRTVERTRGPNPADPVEEVVTCSTYDIRGNVLTVTDALNREAFAYRYDFADQVLRIDSIDAGIRRIVLDAAGSEIERRDSKRALVLQEVDRLNRPARLWARDDGNAEPTLRQRLDYGDEGDPNQPDPVRNAARTENRLGRLHRHYDEAGLMTVEAYDFKGNVGEKARRVIRDERVADCFTQAGVNDWRADEDLLLEPEAYATSMAYDALNRVTSMRYPEDVAGRRSELLPRYNRAGALEHVTLDDDVFVERIAYNVKGQRTFIAYGNHILTRYAYDPDTFRLKRFHSGKFTQPNERTYQPNGGKLQDFAYHYDLAGNILAILERVPGSGIRNNSNTQGLPADQPSFSDPALPGLLASGDALFRRFEYDPFNRLTSATGRECRDIPSPRPWTDAPRCGSTPPNHGAANPHNAPDLTAFYTERYTYDPAGNMLTMRHGRNGNAWTRHFGMGGFSPPDWDLEWRRHFGVPSSWADPPGNRLTHVSDSDPDASQTHFFNLNGNLVRENTERHFAWNHSDQMRAFRVQAGGGEPTVEAHYLYDTAGQRVKKVVHRGINSEATTYIDGLFEHQRWDHGSERGTNNWLHVMDDQQRIALVRRGSSHPDDTGPAVQFHTGDHLGSSSVVIGNNSQWINREEYYPYGETSLGSFSRKRYRYTGKERNEESSLGYHGARYYGAHVCRWVSPDPMGPVDTLNLFLYARGNPLSYYDDDGLEPKTVDLGATREMGPDVTKNYDEYTEVERKVDSTVVKSELKHKSLGVRDLTLEEAQNNPLVNKYESELTKSGKFKGGFIETASPELKSKGLSTRFRIAAFEHFQEIGMTIKEFELDVNHTKSVEMYKNMLAEGKIEYRKIPVLKHLDKQLRAVGLEIDWDSIRINPHGVARKIEDAVWFKMTGNVIKPSKGILKTIKLGLGGLREKTKGFVDKTTKFVSKAKIGKVIPYLGIPINGSIAYQDLKKGNLPGAAAEVAGMCPGGGDLLDMFLLISSPAEAY